MKLYIPGLGIEDDLRLFPPQTNDAMGSYFNSIYFVPLIVIGIY